MKIAEIRTEDITLPLLALFGFMIWTLIYWYADLPEIHKRWPDGECVRMIIGGEQKPCPKTLPQKYLVTWVK